MLYDNIFVVILFKYVLSAPIFKKIEIKIIFTKFCGYTSSLKLHFHLGTLLATMKIKIAKPLLYSQGPCCLSFGPLGEAK
jgi:hypothetical protein